MGKRTELALGVKREVTLILLAMLLFGGVSQVKKANVRKTPGSEVGFLRKASTV
jgi:hypothetical protein